MATITLWVKRFRRKTLQSYIRYLLREPNLHNQLYKATQGKL